MRDFQLHIKDIGEVMFHQNPKAKYLKIKVHPDMGVRVTMPRFVSVENAITFLNTKKNWIENARKRQEDKKDKIPVFDENSHFQTRYHELKISKHPKNTLRARISQGKIDIWYPDYAQAEDPRVQSYIRKIIIEALRIEAKDYLPERLLQLANQHRLKVNNISVRNNKTRWGSCSSGNNISLNLHLMRLPNHLVDYVLLHELAHTLVRNHSKKFWDTLEGLLPGAKRLDKELNRYSLHGW